MSEVDEEYYFLSKIHLLCKTIFYHLKYTKQYKYTRTAKSQIICSFYILVRGLSKRGQLGSIKLSGNDNSDLLVTFHEKELVPEIIPIFLQKISAFQSRDIFICFNLLI